MTPLNEIERDLGWREAELAVLRLHLANEQLPDREKLVLFRAAWSLLYAHYEGFCKFALTVYYDAIVQSGKVVKDLPEGMQGLCLNDDVKNLRSLPVVEFLGKMREFDGEHLGKAPKFPDVDTKSNLWPNVLEELLREADLFVETVSENKRTLSTLVGRRNKIAHGERDIIPELDYYLTFENSVIDVMYEMAVKIDDKLKSF